MFTENLIINFFTMKKQILSIGKALSKPEQKSVFGGAAGIGSYLGAGTCTVYFVIGDSTWNRNYYSSGDAEANASRICDDFTALGGGRTCAYSC